MCELCAEKYLRITQSAKLSYAVVIFKSCIYGAFVAFLVWRLQVCTDHSRQARLSVLVKEQVVKNVSFRLLQGSTGKHSDWELLPSNDDVWWMDFGLWTFEVCKSLN